MCFPIDCLTNIFFVKQIYKLLLLAHNKISLANVAVAVGVGVFEARADGARFVSISFFLYFFLDFRSMATPRFGLCFGQICQR